jgi:hypothetical protein
MAGAEHHRRRSLAVSLWVWPLCGFGVLLLVSIVHLLLFTSDAGSRVIVVNDTSARLHVFACDNAACTEGVSGTNRDLDPGEAAADVADASDGTGRFGEATSPGNRLIGCFPDAHGSHDVPLAQAIRASAVTLCPGQRLASIRRVVFVEP